MRYIAWSLLGMIAYSFVAPYVRRAATKGMPGFMTLSITATMLAAASLLIAWLTGDLAPRYLGKPPARDAYMAGAFLSVGIIAYYHALSLGPVSVVVPIFGMFLVLSSLVGFVLLDEVLTIRKIAGLVLAAVAIYLVAGG